jgi:dipeptidase D
LKWSAPAGYPGWKPEPTSDIVREAQAVHLEVLGKTPELVAMHAELECGVIGEKYQACR